MNHEPKRFDYLLSGRVKGMSNEQLTAHFQLYHGYVAKLNEIWMKLENADRSSPNYAYDEYSELKRREPVAFNGTMLHELFFENIGDGSTQPDAETKRLITSSFGSFERWAEDAKAGLLSGHGWMVLAFDYKERRLFNNLIRTEHDVGLFANTHIMLALDAWEHAYFIDYHTDKESYVANLLGGLDWRAVQRRMKSGGSPLEKAA